MKNNNQAIDVIDKLATAPLNLEPLDAVPVPAVAQARQVVAVTPATILEMAVERGADIGQLERLMDLKIRWDETEAKKAFDNAMAAFKENPPDIIKTKEVSFSGTNYKHATLSDVCDAVIEGLAKVGITHKWTIEQPDGWINVTCKLTHRLGHIGEGTTIKAPADNSGKKNAIQSIGSSVTYLQRYTLLAACGLATREQGDDDGARHKDPAPDWSKDHLENIQFAQTAEQLKAFWAAAASICRRRGNDAIPAYNELKAAKLQRDVELAAEPLVTA